jgi:hydroxymethylbilane synthase
MRIFMGPGPIDAAIAHTIAERLREAGIPVSVVASAPDDAPATDPIGAARDAVLARRADLAAHRYDRIPPVRAEGLAIVAVPLRSDPRDALISQSGRTLRRLRAGTRVAASGAARLAQLGAAYPDLEAFADVRQTSSLVDAVGSGSVAAAVVPAADLSWLGEGAGTWHPLGIEELLPPPAQGIVALECRADDEATRSALTAVDDPGVRAMAVAERSFLVTAQAAGFTSVAALAERFGTTIKLNGLLCIDGRVVRSKMGGPLETSAALGRGLATELAAIAGPQP